MMNYHWYGQAYGLGLGGMIGLGIIALLIGLIVIVLKGLALWTAAKRDEKIWFIVLLIVNTVGILELVYLIFIAKRWTLPVSPRTPENPTHTSV